MISDYSHKTCKVSIVSDDCLPAFLPDNQFKKQKIEESKTRQNTNHVRGNVGYLAVLISTGCIDLWVAVTALDEFLIRR